jgi:hypothetical protein
MKTFEERYTAWLEGRLHGPELTAFERELDTRPVPEGAEDGETQSGPLGDLLRRHLQAPRLANAEFFNHQLLARIAAEDRPKTPRRSGFAWPLPHLAWAGACGLLIALALYQMAIQTPRSHALQMADLVTAPTPAGEPAYSAEIVKAESTDPDISVTPIHSAQDKVTVLWVDGLDYLPANYTLQ